MIFDAIRNLFSAKELRRLKAECEEEFMKDARKNKLGIPVTNTNEGDEE